MDRAVDEEAIEKEKLLQILRDEIATLLCSDEVGEEEKLRRIKNATRIFEHGHS